MARYRIEVKRSAVKELNRIAKPDLKKIVAKIGLLATDPHPKGAVKLYGEDRYRIRAREYRILYSVEHEVLVVYVVKIGHRKEVYR